MLSFLYMEVKKGTMNGLVMYDDQWTRKQDEPFIDG